MRTYLCPRTGKWITAINVGGIREDAAATSRDQSRKIAGKRMREIYIALMATVEYLSEGWAA